MVWKILIQIKQNKNLRENKMNEYDAIGIEAKVTNLKLFSLSVMINLMSFNQT